MEVKEVEKKAIKLENNIAKLLANFSLETGLHIESIDLVEQRTLDSRGKIYSVDCRIVL